MATQEIYRQYEILCMPLRKSHYTFSEMRTKKISPDSEGTTALLRKMRESEKRAAEASGILIKEKRQRERDKGFDEYTSSLSTTSESFAAIQEREEQILSPRNDVGIEPAGGRDEEVLSQEIAPQPRLKRIRDRFQEAVFDFSEIEQERIEQEIDELVNADGYYNEIEPVDIDVEYEKEKKFAAPAVIAIAIFIIYVIIILKI